MAVLVVLQHVCHLFIPYMNPACASEKYSELSSSSYCNSQNRTEDHSQWTQKLMTWWGFTCKVMMSLVNSHAEWRSFQYSPIETAWKLCWNHFIHLTGDGHINLRWHSILRCQGSTSSLFFKYYTDMWISHVQND